MFPDRPALVGATPLTFAELNARVDRLANWLGEIDIAAGDRVAILDNNSSAVLEAYYACATIGAVLVPMNVRLAAPELSYVLRDSGSRVLILAEAFYSLLPALVGDTKIETLLGIGDQARPENVLSYEAELAKPRQWAARHVFEPDDICNIYYTSGTTGSPKGVCLTSASMLASAIDSIIDMQLTEDDVFLHAAPLFHLVDAWAVWALPLIGAPQAVLHFAPGDFLAIVAATRATVTCLPATLINMLTAHPDVGRFDLTSLRFIAYGGSPTPLGILQRAVKMIPTRYIHSYGATETSGVITFARREDSNVDGNPDQLSRVASCGRAVPHIELAIMRDDESFAAGGEIGEIVVRGPRIMRGYWQKPRETAEILRDGWYHTGDLGYLDDHQRLYIVDRKKDMIISGGENIYSVEVENVLSTHPAIHEVAVIGVPDPRWSEAVKAIVVLQDGTHASAEDLIAFCRGKIAGYKIPKSIDFVVGPLPKTGPGKIAKRQLRQSYWAQETRII
ncbi:long-chain acyl-CoA synthetase [Beijerinckia sp. GAS462]|nr:long-chain acyl-CoA synthetase [Beijerinckia sp. GAS462]SED84502.1 long-chain acyl-CoA synthetase [Beijerinckia sp. 28-YEA-48]